MTPQLSPESLQQIRAIVQEAIEAAFRGQAPLFDGINRRFEQIDRRFEQIDQRFDAVDAEFVQVRQEIQNSAAENRRHFGVLHEALTSKLELAIEGFNGHNQRFDRLEHEVHDGFARVDRRLIAISAHMPRAATPRPRRRKSR